MLKESVSGGVTRVSFEPHSRVSVSNVGDVKSELLALVKGEGGSLELDLANLDYIDSSGVGALLSLLRLCKEHNWALSLKGPQQGVKDLFDLLQLQSIFTFV
ncbi:MAG: anti-anti-sigma factor [Bacteroidia bacterium]|nr:MAG: anti-anti-sigma factor [Bacteroidia bacterium]